MKPQLEQNNYLVIPQFIQPNRAKILAQNFRQHCQVYNLSGDDQVNQSKTCYNYIEFLELLVEKTSHVTEEVGESVLPTYSYARQYYENAVLNAHTDRPACEVSLTVHLDGDTPWPFYIENPKGEPQELIIEPGDAIAYLGTRARHWRLPYPGENDYVQVFLHYVKTRGPNSGYYFDKQQ